MGVTYTSAAERSRRQGSFAAAVGRDEIGLALVTCLSFLILVLGYVGRTTAFAVTEKTRATPTIDLSASPSAAALEEALAPAFGVPADRQFAARELARALATGPDRRPLANVGALTSLTVPVRVVDEARRLDRYRARLAEMRARAKSSRAAPPDAIALFTPADIAAIKPAFVVRNLADYRMAMFWSLLGLLAIFQIISLSWRFRGVGGDRVLLAAVHLLVTLGAVAMISRPDPLRDTLLVVRYAEGVLLAAAVCLVVSNTRVTSMPFLQFSYLSLATALVLAIGLIVFGSGPGTSGAKVNLGPLQPAELIRLLLAVFLAGYLGRRWELIRQVRETEWRGRTLPSWLNVPKLNYLMPVLGGVLVALVLFFALRDLGPALLLSLTFLALLSVARAGIGSVVIGIAVLALGFSVGYVLDISNTLTARVAMWNSPWDNGVRGGDQVAQAAWSLAAGGPGGVGLGLGDTRYLPAGHTDLVLAAIGEELGSIGVLVVVLAGGLVAWRGFRAARRASSDAMFFLAIALTLSLTIPLLIMAAGIIGFIPLTGVVTPFVSYGGSAMLVNFLALGLLMAIGRGDGAVAIDARPFSGAVRGLGLGLAACGLVILAGWTRVQAYSADAFLVRPQLSLQADGGRRYQYNPRVLEAARSLPRGTIFDRREVPLAASPEVVLKAKAELDRLRISPRDACPVGVERCYPLGGRAFHLIGDAERRTNWSASNTSYVERDAEDDLRGFDDRAETVRTGEGSDMGLALRRDYADLIPLVRHRWEPDHPAVVTLRQRTRDVHLTVDARLQAEVASLTARALATTGASKAAVVVLDANSGEVLSSVSYPWPADREGAPPQSPGNADALLDRARYGLYPPGSTFKLITAAAALRLDPALHSLQFTCSRLADGRVGARISGWSRPIRDDVQDEHAHGTQTMHAGLVNSCNAYFAQLAVRLGVEPLSAAATAAGIVFPTKPEDRARETLPHSGFGQGDVLATPLRMARVAAAIASDGMLREPGIGVTDVPTVPKPFLTEASARTLAADMRSVVTDGTGRLLRGHATRIAGKTGTAEVDDAPSHAWFIGFAPSGPATRRVAFAVLIENAGYGGASAAALAGQVVSAAQARGFVQ
jgi:cell division protein FtsW (lipid II flippase)